MSINRYDKGDWKAVCDVCGRHLKASQLRKRWDGLMTCSDDWEPRHPQDFVRARIDIQAVPWTRPEAPDQFAYVICNTRSSIVGVAQTGCAIVGYGGDVAGVPPSSFTP